MIWYIYELLIKLTINHKLISYKLIIKYINIIYILHIKLFINNVDRCVHYSQGANRFSDIVNFYCRFVSEVLVVSSFASIFER